MAKKKKKTQNPNQTTIRTDQCTPSALKLRDPEDAFAITDVDLHVYGEHNSVCLTNSKGHATPENRSPLELFFDATEGFIPVWGPDAILRWRFNESSMRYFQNPQAAKRVIRELFGEAIERWGDASPVKFTEQNDNWDFELVMEPTDKCSANGCTLARAFFPDSGRHNIAMYPKLFQQTHEEQIETLIHEIGHVFGLRHFFANVTETAWPSVQFGHQNPFTIMNYGPKSILTETDRADLKLFYSMVWSGEMSEISGTPIVEFRPFHEFVSIANPARQARQFADWRRCSNCGVVN